ncbi:alpha-1,2-glucosyltransferase [Ceratobasidium sp. AG-Ba]|nr:alpha-1,2-glucosyltransferase [Ceratobasidium sp. AG-Ba]
MESQNTIVYAAYAVFNVMVAKEVNNLVLEPYMDEPFHIPQAQAYCGGNWDVWDPKLTTPPGLYVLSVLLKKVFLFKCTVPILPLYRSDRPPRTLLQPTLESIVISAFPLAWFFSFLYYTELGSVVFVLGTVLAAGRGAHLLAALHSTDMRRKRVQSKVSDNHPGRPLLYDPMALDASLSDIPTILSSGLYALPSMMAIAWPYVMPIIGFASFVFWNGGIVLGDKSNHVPALHVPQIYYFTAFASCFGLPVLASTEGGVARLAGDVLWRMFGGKWYPVFYLGKFNGTNGHLTLIRRSLITVTLIGFIMLSVHLFTIHHPFLLSDNRHYTFYVWRRVYLAHWLMPYILSPFYLAFAWAWFLRVGRYQTLLQTLLLPVCMLPTLLPTPLLEPRYFLVPYLLLRLQVLMPNKAVLAEAAWYGFINWATMFVFLYMEREGVGRFMW